MKSLFYVKYLNKEFNICLKHHSHDLSHKLNDRRLKAWSQTTF